jgi:hypothetical protein
MANSPAGQASPVFDPTLVHKIYTAIKEAVLEASTRDDEVCMVRTDEAINAMVIMIAQMGVQSGVTTPRETREFVKGFSTALKQNIALIHESGIKRPFTPLWTSSRSHRH